MSSTKCSICTKDIDKQYTPEGKMYWNEGHNAEPINNGRCCSLCNENIVLPKRLNSYYERKDNG